MNDELVPKLRCLATRARTLMDMYPDEADTLDILVLLELVVIKAESVEKLLGRRDWAMSDSQKRELGGVIDECSVLMQDENKGTEEVARRLLEANRLLMSQWDVLLRPVQP